MRQFSPMKLYEIFACNSEMPAGYAVKGEWGHVLVLLLDETNGIGVMQLHGSIDTVHEYMKLTSRELVEIPLGKDNKPDDDHILKVMREPMTAHYRQVYGFGAWCGANLE